MLFAHPRGRFLGRAIGFVLAACAPCKAHAETGATSSLSWLRLPGTETCIGSIELARAVEARLGRTVFVSPSHAALAVEGRVAREESGAGTRYHATITVSRVDGSLVGTREIASAGSSCRELDEGLAMIIALLVDPDAKEPAASPEPSRAQSPGSSARDIEVGAGLFSSIGVLPGLSWGAVATLRLSLDLRWSFDVRGGATLPTDRTDLGTNHSFDEFFGAVVACAAVVPRRTRLDLCAGGELDHLTATGDGVGDGATFGSVLARITLSRALGDVVRVAIDLDAGVPLARPDFTVAVLDPRALVVERRSVFHEPFLWARLGLWVGLRF